MIVDRKSWHYRWMAWAANKQGDWDFREKEPKSLCAYFWTFVYKTLGLMFIATLLTAVVVCLPLSAWSGFHNGSKTALVVFVTYCAVAFLFISVMAIVALRDYIKYQLPDLAERNKVVGKTLSFTTIAASTLKSGKNKVCPMIQYQGGQGPRW